MKKFIIAALGVALGLASLNASADTTTTFSSTTLDPTLELIGLCTVVVANTAITDQPTFGTTGTFRVDDIGTVTVNGCTAAYKIGAGGSANTSGTRRLKLTTGASYIPYTLGISKTGGGVATASTIAATDDFGTDTMTGFATPFSASPLSVTGSVTDADVIFTVSAQFNIPNAATAPVGTYSDSVVVGVEF